MRQSFVAGHEALEGALQWAKRLTRESTDMVTSDVESYPNDAIAADLLCHIMVR